MFRSRSRPVSTAALGKYALGEVTQMTVLPPCRRVISRRSLQADRSESRVLDHCQRPVEAIHRGDRERGDARPGPAKRTLAIEIESHDLSAEREVHAAADHMFPSPAVKSVVAEAGDDAVVGDEPRTRLTWSQLGRCRGLGSCCRDVGREAKRGFDQGSFALVENDADAKRPGAGVCVVAERHGKVTCRVESPAPRIRFPMGELFCLLALRGHS
jgi:hypothetical protein